MAEGLGSAGLWQMCPKSAEHTACLVQVTQHQTDGVSAKKPGRQFLIIQAEQEAEASKHHLPCGWLVPGGVRVLTHVSTHTHTRSTASDIQSC